MRNDRLLPYETIVQAAGGEPEAVYTVLKHYERYIKYQSIVSGQVNKDAEEYIRAKLLASLFKFRFE